MTMNMCDIEWEISRVASASFYDAKATAALRHVSYFVSIMRNYMGADVPGSQAALMLDHALDAYKAWLSSKEPIMDQ